jgi:hypothetical protein
LKTNEADFAELRAASQRPYSQYPIDYEVPNPVAIRLPHLSSVRAICRRLQLKACAELALGRSEEALEDVKLSLSLADSVKNEPFLVSYLVRVACLQIATQPIWEGLAEHAWSDAELRELETRLQKYDFVADLKPALDAERASGIAMIDFIKHTGDVSELASVFLSSPWGWPNAVWRILPSGWYEQEQLNYCYLYQAVFANVSDAASRRVSPSRIAANSGKLEQAFDVRGFTILLVHHRFMSGMMLPGLSAVIRKGAAAQIAVDQAVLACALERYRLANGQFPEGLEALTPQFVTKPPHDVITGEPYKYRRREDGQFVLYSVGWNEKDDGGLPGRSLFDQEAGDWVWQYPSKQ